MPTVVLLVKAKLQDSAASVSPVKKCRLMRLLMGISKPVSNYWYSLLTHRLGEEATVSLRFTDKSFQCGMSQPFKKNCPLTDLFSKNSF